MAEAGVPRRGAGLAVLPCSPEAPALFWGSARHLRQLFGRISAESSWSSAQRHEPSSPALCQQTLLCSGESAASCGEVAYAPVGRDVLKLG